MLLAIAGVSCGGLDYLHARQHQIQQQQWIAAVRASAMRHGSLPNVPPMPLPGRCDDGCQICQALHMPLTAQAAHAAIAPLGLLVSIVILRPPVVWTAAIHLPIFLRGPPVV